MHPSSILGQASKLFSVENQATKPLGAAPFWLRMSHACCKQFPSIFNGCQSLAAAPCDMRRDKRPALARWISTVRRLASTRAGRIALALLILNEVRGMIVVAVVVKAWLEHRP